MSKSPPRSSCHATYRTPTESTARDTSPCADPAVPVSSTRELAPKVVAPIADVARYTFAFPVRLSWYATWMRPREGPTAEGPGIVVHADARSEGERRQEGPRPADVPVPRAEVLPRDEDPAEAVQGHGGRHLDRSGIPVIDPDGSRKGPSAVRPHGGGNVEVGIGDAVVLPRHDDLAVRGHCDRGPLLDCPDGPVSAETERRCEGWPAVRSLRAGAVP